MFNLVYSNLNDSDLKPIISDINLLFDTGNWCYTAPYFQTWPNLLESNELHWLKFKSKLLDSVSQITNKKVVNIACWAYKSFLKNSSRYDKKNWHRHDTDTTNKLSAIFYLLFPNGSNGTEYLDKDGKIKYMPFKEKHWTFFPSSLIHRPGFWDHENMFKSRITIASDLYFE